MPQQNIFVQSFNVGVVDKDKLPRVDLERMRIGAEDQTNLLCTTTGSMFLRPGTEFLGHTKDDQEARTEPFIYSANDGALLEFVDGQLFVWDNDARVTREAVTANVSQGNFGGVGAWVLTASDGATCTISGGALRMTASANGSSAVAKQEVTVNESGVEHALKIVIGKGPVTFRCGSTSGGDQYISETELKSGVHSLAFTPTGSSFWIFFKSASETLKTVTQCTIEAAGAMDLSTPWNVNEITSLQFAQSADVMFIASGEQQKRLERRGTHSWSLVDYLADDGPFGPDRTAPVRLKPSVTRGNGTLTASDNFFTQDHVGAIFRLFHNGQHIVQSLGAEQTFTDPIKVTGVGTSDRQWTYTVTGTWSGTLYVQSSVDAETFGFKQYQNSSTDTTKGFTGNVAGIVQYDTRDNAIVWYRIGFENSYTSGAPNVAITYDAGGGFGIARVTAFNSKTSVDIEILKPFKNTVYTSDWLEGMWSDQQGWPTGVCLSEGRLFWAGLDRFWASVSDAYESFDKEVEGDSGPINRSIAIGSINLVQWMLPLQRVVIGTDSSEISAKSSTLDEPLSPTNLTLKSSSSVGSADVAAGRIDGRGVFVDRTGKAIFELLYSADSGDYKAAELTRLCSTFFDIGIVCIAVQRRPDTRVWAVLEDGTAMCMIYEPDQQVVAFIPITTDGDYEWVSVLPGAEQDFPYFTVNRSTDSGTKRYVEKMARDVFASPVTKARVTDAFMHGTNSPQSATISGLTHLEDRQVKVWADGAPITEVVNGRTVPKLFTVSGGSINVGDPVIDWVVGLPYQGTYKSSRLAYAAAKGTAMLQKKRVNQLGLVLTDYVRSGILYGRSMEDDELHPLPRQKDFKDATEVVLGDVDDDGEITFDGKFARDPRICFTVDWPCKFLGLQFNVDTNG